MFDVHAAAIEAAIRGCPVVTTYSLSATQLSPETGYVEGEVRFVDGSRLVFFEFLRRAAAGGWGRDKYRYQFMDDNNRLLFRYDNAPHHREVETFPHHKHVPSGVTYSSALGLAEVLIEAEAHVLGIP